MTIFHELVFRLTYSPVNVPTFETAQEQDDFHKALGRMVCFALQQNSGDPQDMVQLVNANLTQNPLEICACYYPALPAAQTGADGYPYYYKGASGKIEQALTPLLDQARDIGRPFVMAAVKHRDGLFGFHS